MKSPADAKLVSLSEIRTATMLSAHLEHLASPFLREKRVLWVDDHPENNELPKRIIERAGATVQQVRKTEEALAAMHTAGTSFSLVITDMGRGSEAAAGLVLLRAMRSSGTETPCIVYSDGQEAEQRKAEIRETGGIGPVVGPENLLREISLVLQNTA